MVGPSLPSLPKQAAAFNGNHAAVLQYLMIERGLYGELAKRSAEAVQGLNPKINVWTTGAASGDSASNASGINPSMRPIHDIFQSLPPLLTSIQDQTGIQPPAWLAQMGGATEIAPGLVGQVGRTSNAGASSSASTTREPLPVATA